MSSASVGIRASKPAGGGGGGGSDRPPGVPSNVVDLTLPDLWTQSASGYSGYYTGPWKVGGFQYVKISDAGSGGSLVSVGSWLTALPRPTGIFVGISGFPTSITPNFGVGQFTVSSPGYANFISQAVDYRTNPNLVLSGTIPPTGPALVSITITMGLSGLYVQQGNIYFVGLSF